MRSRIPRASEYAPGTLPVDRTPDRVAPRSHSSPAMSAAEQDIARPKHRTPDEQATYDRNAVAAHGNLAAMCFERAGVDLTVPTDQQDVPHGWSRLPTTAPAVAGTRDFLRLAEMLGLDGAS
jgi:hypothetical protein